MNGQCPAVVDFYDRHPISEEHVMAALERHGRDVRRLSPEDLYEWDQDHYGGLAAVDALARRAEIRSGAEVLDVCAGLGGPARFLAHTLGCRVTCLDLSPRRSAANRRLSALVGLARQISVVNGDAQRFPVRRGAFDAVISQEGLLHVPDKGAVLRECARALVPGGRIAFTDWIATPRLEDGERRRLGEWMAATSLQRTDDYRALLARAGFSGVEAEDLSAEWRVVLRERVHMYRGMRQDTVARLGPVRYDEYNQLYEFFVGLVEAGKLGGARFSGRAFPRIA